MDTVKAAEVRPRDVVRAIAQTIVGQTGAVEALVLALIAGGHVLLEGAPGVAKTLACRALAAAPDPPCRNGPSRRLARWHDSQRSMP